MTGSNRRKEDNIPHVKSGWEFLSYMAEYHKILFAITPSLFIATIFFGIFLIMNVGYDARLGKWQVIPRINVDIDIKKEGVKKNG